MTSHVIYLGELRTTAKHEQSGSSIETDAPIDNHGKGERFSPTDLVATALASCMLTIMGISANSHGVAFNSATIEVTKQMAENPRRVSGVVCHIKVKSENYGEKEIRLLKGAALSCPVAKSLHPDIKQEITFEWI